MQSQSRKQIFIGAIIIAIIALILAIYYIIPGIYHPLTSSDPYLSHKTHAILFGAIFVICVIGALVTRPRPDLS